MSEPMHPADGYYQVERVQRQRESRLATRAYAKEILVKRMFWSRPNNRGYEHGMDFVCSPFHNITALELATLTYCIAGITDCANWEHGSSRATALFVGTDRINWEVRFMSSYHEDLYLAAALKGNEEKLLARIGLMKLKSL